MIHVLRDPRIINSGGAYGDMNADTRARLYEYFQPLNEDLYRLLDRDFKWQR